MSTPNTPSDSDGQAIRTREQRIRKISNLALTGILAALAVAFLILGEHSMAAWMAAAAATAALLVPSSKNIHSISDFRALQSRSVPLDERREMIKLRAEAASFRAVNTLAGLAVIVSMFVSMIRDREGPVIWWPALALFFGAMALNALYTWHYSRRM